MTLFNDEYNKLARTISRVSEVLDKITETVPKDLLVKFCEEQLLYVAYVCKIGIIDRIEKYKWNVEKPIVIHAGKIFTIKQGLIITVLKLLAISASIKDAELEDKITEILQQGELFYEIEKELPNEWKLMIK